MSRRTCGPHSSRCGWAVTAKFLPSSRAPRRRRSEQPDIVIQAILRQSNVDVTREAYVKRDAVDSRSLAAMAALQNLICNQYATAATGRPNEVVVQ